MHYSHCSTWLQVRQDRPFNAGYQGLQRGGSKPQCCESVGMTAKVLRAQGLPFSASRQEIEEFFAGYGLSGRLHIQADAFGQRTGIAIVEFASQADAQRAKSDLNMQHMGSRYIELLDARDRDLDCLALSNGHSRPTVGKVLRMQGLPFSASKQDIEQFFTGYGLSGRMHIQLDGFGQPTGIAIVELVSETDAQRAKVELNRQHMGSRYIELLDAKERDLDCLSSSQARPVAAQVLRVQGLPFSASKNEIEQFFAGYALSGRAHFQLDAFGQKTGIAFVEFDSEADAKRAKSDLNMQHMGSRYIELLDARDRDLDGCFGDSNGGMKDSMMDFLQMMSAFAGWSGKSGGTAGNRGGGWDKSKAPAGKVLRVQGLPFSASRQDVQTFFMGYRLSGRMHLPTDAAGQTTGIAFVEFVSEAEAKRAWSQKNFQYMGPRYIELMEARDQDIQMHFGSGNGGYGAMKGCFGARAFPY